jgi:hypothetical protein
MCSMASAEDVAAHSSFHRKFEQGVRFHGWKEERVVQRFDDSPIRGARVVVLQCGDKPAHLHKLGQLKDIMDAEMGVSSGMVGVDNHTGQSLLRTATDDRAFIYISADGATHAAVRRLSMPPSSTPLHVGACMLPGIAVACAIVQRITVAYAVAPFTSDRRQPQRNWTSTRTTAAAATTTTTTTTTFSGLSAGEAEQRCGGDDNAIGDETSAARALDPLQCSRRPHACCLGIKQMWVHRRHVRSLPTASSRPVCLCVRGGDDATSDFSHGWNNFACARDGRTAVRRDDRG